VQARLHRQEIEEPKGSNDWRTTIIRSYQYGDDTDGLLLNAKIDEDFGQAIFFKKEILIDPSDYHVKYSQL
jgi:hypothetical protein